MPQTLNNLGAALADAGRRSEAVETYRRAIAIAPDDPVVHFNLGVVLKDLDRWDEAIACYRRALALSPSYADAHFNLMQAAETGNDMELLRTAVAAAKQSCGPDPRLAMGEAWLLRRERDYEKARAALEAVPPSENADPTFLSERAYLLGDLCDRLTDTEAAYAAFLEGGRRARATLAAARANPAGFVARIETLSHRFTPDWVASWSKAASTDARAAPVFMIGFPRSGTTLLDSVLRSHHAIAVAEEKPAVTAMRRALARLPGGEPDGIAAIGADGLATLRQAYFSELDRHLSAPDRDRIVIDKLPLNIVEVGLIHRVFPDAKFLLVLRHPCDCVLSCFMQSFRLNDAMANFLDLEHSAALYDRVFRLWETYRRVLPLAVHASRYEDLVTDFDGTLSPILEFLGVEWDDGVRNYAETARSRGRISTPSYNQVTEPIYTRASGRWESYRAHMEPVLPPLLDWAEKLGYGR